jgi:PadR family transcriptional regulator, regulatory protein PadR
MPRQLTLLQGTLDLLVLKTIAAAPLHGYAIATAIHERTRGALDIDDAALYQSLHRLARQRLVDAEWGASENNRRARYYELTAEGRRRLREQEADFKLYARAVFAVLEG